ncbi:type I DNA topoisomerase [Metapseudomonas furukawaii]|uniref:DNA topoisomerase 1 n=1 Tax=Metapseudomonas furukawaii TaxID=1149133 RepID=A0AAD1C4L3_METFU|nr:type I DNA topoisomerase [Pseudomonas furukawaii]ELS27578.1 DNA topoisomerase I [Pseudomonas furukawaii]BAU77416.1 DNA topoisomerase I [Pseudomonas furukawaii]
MASNLMIIESPGKAKKLREILAKVRPGEDWKIEASVGHIRDLPASGDGDDLITTGVRRSYAPVYELTERGAKVARELKKAVSTAHQVYLATDPDREGESISWHLKEALRLSDPIRITFNEITETAVRKAFGEARSIDMQLVGSQEARRVLDRLVGYLVSPELRRQTGENLTAGRVQSVAVYLVVLREREIRAFKMTVHYGASLSFAAEGKNTWKVEWDTKAGFTTEASPYVLDRALAERVAALTALEVTSFEESESTRNPPAPFTTSTIQQAASNSLGWKTDRTMKVAQQLYEQGLISYHRTDNPNVSEDSMPKLRAAAAVLGLEVVATRRQFKAKDGAQEGHPAITPTYWDKDEAGETDEQKALYKLIRVRALASQLLPAKYAVRSAVLKANEQLDGRDVHFKATGRTLTDHGWLKLLAGDDTDDERQEEAPNPLPVLAVGQRVAATSGEVLEKKTKAPPRFTEASLVKALEAEGIGRPATYAAIMKNIIDVRGYVGEQKRFLHPLPPGEQIIERLEGRFSFVQVGFTREMEEDLDRIADGKTTYKPVIQKMHAVLESELQAVRGAVPTAQKPASEHLCPQCQKPLRLIRKSANGPFWGCTGYQEGCKASFEDKGGKPVLAKKQAPTPSIEHTCRAEGCGKGLTRRPAKKRGTYWWGCSGYPACKQTYFDKSGKPDYDAATKEKTA